MDLKDIHNRNDPQWDLAFLAFPLVLRTLNACSLQSRQRLQHKMFIQQAEMLGMLNPTVDHFYYVYPSSPYNGIKDLNN